MALGVAIGGTAIQNFMARYLAEAGLPLEIASNAEGYAQVLLALPKDSEHRIAVVAVYAKAFRGVFEVITGISVLGGLAGMLLEKRSMDRSLDSGHQLTRENVD